MSLASLCSSMGLSGQSQTIPNCHLDSTAVGVAVVVTEELKGLLGVGPWFRRQMVGWDLRVGERWVVGCF